MRFSDLLSPFRVALFILHHGFSRNWYCSFYSTAATKMYKPFRYYKNHLHGYPCQWSFRDSSFPEINEFFKDCTEEDWNDPRNDKTSDAAQKAWDWVLGEIEYALRFEYDNEKPDYVEINNPDYDKAHTIAVDRKLKRDFTFESWLSAMDDPRYGKTKYDRATSEANMRRAQRGFELMGKYWMNLWD
ncbi:MAG TPA: hypothetical protein PK542_06010 [Treponemataceae bacterium]|nr:hypothetical protein [Treponemataceae bacterium]HPS44023.1 hypothetical protein [Treponemataceae bacterium]